MTNFLLQKIIIFVDIAVLATVIFCFFVILTKLKHPNFVIAFAIFCLFAFVCNLLKMKVSAIVFLAAAASTPLVFCLLFTTELRRLIYSMRKKSTEISRAKTNFTEEELIATEIEIIKAVQNMAKNDVGALLVFSNKNIPSTIVDSGIKLEANVSSQLLESIFNTKSPLHDGAVMIVGNQIVSAGCFLPLSQQTNISKEYGTRHRAGIGVTEENNEMMSIIVSEETGIISIAENGILKTYADTRMLTEKLDSFFGITKSAKAATVKKFWWKK